MKRPHRALPLWGGPSSRRRLRHARIAVPALVVLVGTGLQGASATPPDGSAVVNAAAAAVASVTLRPEADATVSVGRPDANFGRGEALQVLGRPRMDSYLRFRIPAGATGRARLRLWVLNPTANGPGIRRSDGPLNEGAVTWEDRPTQIVGNPVDSGPLEEGTWAEWDVTRFVSGPGDLTLVAVADSIDAVVFGSRESDHSPQLVIETPNAPTTPSPPTTSPRPTPPTTAPGPTTPTPPGPSGPPVCQANWEPPVVMAQLKDGLGEMSAFVASPTHPGWGWGIRDSGRPASLYALKPKSDGTAQSREFSALGLVNSDWEDMAWTPGPTPGAGHLWVLENVGNGWTGNRKIYQFEESSPTEPAAPPPLKMASLATSATTEPPPTTAPPTTTSSTTAPPSTTSSTTAPPPPQPPSPPPAEASLIGTYEWAYPDEQVNSETMFVFDGDLVVVTKTEPSRVYRFDGPLVESVVNVPTYVGTLPAGERLSVAALSVDQRTLAVSSHGKLDVYENRGNPHDLAALIRNHVVRHVMPADNREGGSFFPYGSCDLLLVAESKTVWKLEHR
ncbi:MAG TPA: DNRLRE domain-containing protein [Acidimicrobiia bacterium]|nr:DNRLRE domain-containing protein [Acidimicrobiia bacterium]